MASITYYGGVISPARDIEYDEAPTVDAAITKARAALKSRGWSGTSATITDNGMLRGHLVNTKGRVILRKSH